MSTEMENVRRSILKQTPKESATPTAPSGANETPEKPFEKAKRPQSLEKNMEGGSLRLTVLGDILRNYSVVESRRSSMFNPNVAMEEIYRLQWLINNKMPATSNVSLITLASYAQPRKTLLLLQAEMEGAELDDDRKWRPSEQLRLHDFIREMSLKKLEADTFKKLQIIYNNQVALLKDSNEFLPAFSPFGWTVEDFLARRHERNTVWLDLLLGRSEKELEILKFKCDIEELLKLLSLLFQGLKPSNADVREDLYAYVRDAYEFLKFPQALKTDAKQNMEILREQVNTYLDMMNFKRGAEEEAYKASLEQKLMDIAVIGPIELRYEVNWMHTKTDQAIMKMTNALEEIENKANEYRKEESKENYCARCVLDMYYLDIDKYKNRIAELSYQYDTELEKAENEIAYKKISMDKLHEQRKFLESEIVRFHDEIEQLHQKELEEQMAEDERKREEELRALEEAAAKAKKAKGKAKTKKK